MSSQSPDSLSLSLLLTRWHTKDCADLRWRQRLCLFVCAEFYSFLYLPLESRSPSTASHFLPLYLSLSLSPNCNANCNKLEHFNGRNRDQLIIKGPIQLIPNTLIENQLLQHKANRGHNNKLATDWIPSCLLSLSTGLLALRQQRRLLLYLFFQLDKSNVTY